jgi:hypothetical protein
MRSHVPEGDLAAVIEQAVTEKLERLEARRFATTKAPHALHGIGDRLDLSARVVGHRHRRRRRLRKRLTDLLRTGEGPRRRGDCSVGRRHGCDAIVVIVRVAGQPPQGIRLSQSPLWLCHDHTDPSELRHRVPAGRASGPSDAVPWHTTSYPVRAPLIVGDALVVICHAKLETAGGTDLVGASATARSRWFFESWVAAHRTNVSHFSGHGTKAPGCRSKYVGLVGGKNVRVVPFGL